MKNSGLNAKRE